MYWGKIREGWGDVARQVRSDTTTILGRMN